MTYASGPLQFISVFARLHPAIWEVVGPYGPPNVLARSGLNPQPLPPRELLALSVSRGAAAIADATIAAHLAGQDARQILEEAGDDMCPTPPTPKIHWPRLWPVPWPPGEPYPIDPELVGAAVQAQAAMLFQSYADGIEDRHLSAAFGDLAGRLAAAASEPAAVAVG